MVLLARSGTVLGLVKAPNCGPGPRHAVAVVEAEPATAAPAASADVAELTRAAARNRSAFVMHRAAVGPTAAPPRAAPRIFRGRPNARSGRRRSAAADDRRVGRRLWIFCGDRPPTIERWRGDRSDAAAVNILWRRSRRRRVYSAGRGGRFPRRPAERARTCASLGVPHGASLATQSAAMGGIGFASFADFVLDADGAPVLLLDATRAEHAKNLAADPRCSLLLAARGSAAATAAAPRVTVGGSASPVRAAGA